MNDRHIRMRRELYRQLWGASEDYKKTPQPCPVFDDGEIMKGLQELLGLDDLTSNKIRLSKRDWGIIALVALPFVAFAFAAMMNILFR